MQTFQPPDLVTETWFGFPVAGVGENILVGAAELEVDEAKGKAYLFDADGEHLRTLAPPEDQTNANFGWDGTIVGDRFLVGAPRMEIGTNVETGQALLFDINGDLLTTFDAPDAQIDSRFGSTVATVGDNVLIAAERYNIESILNAGQVYLFDPSGNHLETLQAPEPQTGSWFGRSLASLGEGTRPR